jgi:DNA-binding transcriptional MocR family regulator
LWVRIRHQLAQRIRKGTYPEGEHMPPLRELTSEFGVSTDTIQRVMLNLEASGLVRRIPGKGYYSLADTKKGAPRKPGASVNHYGPLPLRSPGGSYGQGTWLPRNHKDFSYQPRYQNNS